MCFQARVDSNLHANMDATLAKTAKQFDEVIGGCRDLFTKKTHDYGTAWRILRTPSLTDQIFIKAQRIRTLEEKGTSRVGEGIHDEFVGIINYAVMALIQMQLNSDESLELGTERASSLYDAQVAQTKALMLDKNHDYGEAWREMRVSSITDLILMKLYRIRQIEDNQGKTLISEGISASYFDMINYAIFAMIRLKELGQWHLNTSANA
jgi:hypothetical protein